jgi:hypothetical protein
VMLCLIHAERYVASMLRRVIFTGWETLEMLGNVLQHVARPKSRKPL